MWAIVARAFLWLSGGYVLNDITSTVGGWFGTSSKEQEAPQWFRYLAAPVIVIGSIVLAIWLLGKSKRSR